MYEVHSAFNVLEQELWNRTIKNSRPEILGESLGYISTVLGAGKESLALAYVSLASKHRTETLNLEGMFNR